jgi:hypothetical protein
VLGPSDSGDYKLNMKIVPEIKNISVALNLKVLISKYIAIIFQVDVKNNPAP